MVEQETINDSEFLYSLWYREMLELLISVGKTTRMESMDGYAEHLNELEIARVQRMGWILVHRQTTTTTQNNNKQHSNSESSAPVFDHTVAALNESIG